MRASKVFCVCTYAIAEHVGCRFVTTATQQCSEPKVREAPVSRHVKLSLKSAINNLLSFQRDNTAKTVERVAGNTALM